MRAGEGPDSNGFSRFGSTPYDWSLLLSSWSSDGAGDWRFLVIAANMFKKNFFDREVEI